eukprot:2377540-Rhodomonas_salina.1
MLFGTSLRTESTSDLDDEMDQVIEDQAAENVFGRFCFGDLDSQPTESDPDPAVVWSNSNHVVLCKGFTAWRFAFRASRQWSKRLEILQVAAARRQKVQEKSLALFAWFQAARTRQRLRSQQDETRQSLQTQVYRYVPDETIGMVLHRKEVVKFVLKWRKTLMCQYLDLWVSRNEQRAVANEETETPSQLLAGLDAEQMNQYPEEARQRLKASMLEIVTQAPLFAGHASQQQQ